MKILIYGFLVINYPLMFPTLILLSFIPLKKKLPFIPRLYINKKLIEKENYIKYLGINLDSNLRWKHHRFEKIYHIVDSHTVHAMIQKSSYGFNTFAATRIGEIQKGTIPENW